MDGFGWMVGWGWKVKLILVLFVWMYWNALKSKNYIEIGFFFFFIQFIFTMKFYCSANIHTHTHTLNDKEIFIWKTNLQLQQEYSFFLEQFDRIFIYKECEWENNLFRNLKIEKNKHFFLGRKTDFYTESYCKL